MLGYLELYAASWMHSAVVNYYSLSLEGAFLPSPEKPAKLEVFTRLVLFSMFDDVLVTFGCSGCSPPLHILITTTGDPQIFQLARRVLLKLSELLVCRIVRRWFYNALGRNTNDVASREAFQKTLQ